MRVIFNNIYKRDNQVTSSVTVEIVATIAPLVQEQTTMCAEDAQTALSACVEILTLNNFTFENATKFACHLVARACVSSFTHKCIVALLPMLHDI